MARRKSPSFEQQRGAIHAAAAELFAQHGYMAASIAELARSCGVSKGLLYHYYRDKEHLLFDVVEFYIDRLQQIVDEVAAEARARRLAPPAQLQRLIERFMAEYAYSAARHRVIVQDVKYLQRKHRLRVQAKQRRVVQGFADLIVRINPALAGGDLLKPVTMILFGMINWAFTWFDERGPLSYAELARVVSALFLAGVGAAAQRPRAVRAARPPLGKAGAAGAAAAPR